MSLLDDFDLDPVWILVASVITVVIAVTAFALYAVNSWLLGSLYRKVGIATWKAWVPVYQLWPFFELGGFRGAWSLTALLPTLQSIFSTIALVQLYLSADFGQESGLSTLAGFGDSSFLTATIWVLFVLVGQLVPLLLTVLGAIVAYRIGKVFGRDAVLCAVAYILLPTILFGLLGLGKTEANRETLRAIARPGLIDD